MPFTRRSLLQWSLSLGAIPFANLALSAQADQTLTPELDSLLDEVERRAYRYFDEQANPANGLVKDRARMDGPDTRRTASIAATGFGLTAMCIADQRGYGDRVGIRARVLTTLRYLAGQAPQEHGFFYHFVNADSGERVRQSEISSIDTTWLLCGVLHCKSHFDDLEVQRLAQDILGRVDWVWMLNGQDTLSHGWKPETGFLPYRWDTYSELLAMYLLAIGSTTYPIPATSWNAWKRPKKTYEGVQFIDADTPLFVHQYSHAWFDFRARRDQYADYFENSRLATLAHRKYCQELTSDYSWYGTEMWGVTASDSRRGYVAWGSPGSRASPDGTLVPCAAGWSVAFLPRECGAVLETMLARYGSKVWGRYGFVDAFHPQSQWYDQDVIGIDQGIMLLMAENARSGSVWKSVMATPEAALGMERVGLVAARA